MKLKKTKKNAPVLVNFKMEKADIKLMVSKAKKYTKGNISQWLRFSSVNHVPKRKDLG